MRIGRQRRLGRILLLLALCLALAAIARVAFLVAALQRLAAIEAVAGGGAVDRLEKEWPEDVASAGVGAAEAERWHELGATLSEAGASPEETAAVTGVIQARYPAERTVAAPVHAQPRIILDRRYWAVTVCWGNRPDVEKAAEAPAHVSVLVIQAAPPCRVRVEQDVPRRRPSARLDAPVSSPSARSAASPVPSSLRQV